MQIPNLLQPDFYLRDDVVKIARELIGKILVTRFDNEITSGIITETEAYAGITDRASHAFGGRLTGRTSVMYQTGGTAYVYLCYGVHSLFNVVTNAHGIPDAVLIRGIKPLVGIEKMLARFGKSKFENNLGSGPGKVSKCLGIHFSHSGLPITDVTGENKGNELKIWIEDNDLVMKEEDIKSGTRIGVDYAGEDAALPFRFLLSTR